MHYYLHIPFCRQRCPYCKFALTPIFDEAKKRRYIAHLKMEIKSSLRKELSEGNEDGGLVGQSSQTPIPLPLREIPLSQGGLDTLYFGGGTPSVLSLSEVREILSCFVIQTPLPPLSGGQSSSQLYNQRTHSHPANEVSFECNPEDITTEYVDGLIKLGINRLSIGVQSLNDATLKAIHRSDKDSIFQALASIENATLSFSVGESFEKPKRSSLDEDDKKENSATSSVSVSVPHSPSVNVDFILGLPYSKPGETLENIRELHKRFPLITHTSVYMLEAGEYPRGWKKDSITEEEMENEYREICEYFDSIGWHHYEISNWARPGYECEHNQAYWNHSEYRGFGLSATSLEEISSDKKGGESLTRAMNSESFSGYYRGEKKYEEILTEKEIHLENMIHTLRTFCLDATIFQDHKLDGLQEKGLIKIRDKKIILTPAGIFRENFILGELMDE